jgi:hypothetical protein
MRKTIVRTLAIGAILAVPVIGATAANGAPAPVVVTSSTGVHAIVGTWTRQLWPDDGPNFDQLTVQRNGKVRIGGQPDNLYDCTGTLKATGKNRFLFTLTCKSAGETYHQKAKAEYNPKHRTITIHLGRDETFSR